MKTISPFFTFVIGLLLLSVSLSASAEPTLWQLEKNGVKSYLFGTVHVGDASMNGLPEKVKKAITNSDKVVVEVNISAISPLEIQQRSMPFMILPNGRTLPDEMSAKSYQKLKDYFASKQINIAMFNTLKPWAVLLTVAQIEYQNLGYTEQYGIDKQVLTFAASHNKPVVELETLEQQLGIFDNLGGHSDTMVADTFKQLADIENYFNKLIQAWKQGDEAVLSRYYTNTFDSSEYGRLSEKAMLIDRNHNWVKKLAEPLGKQPLFIAVGALHLPEKNGLLSLLKQQGVSITKL